MDPVSFYFFSSFHLSFTAASLGGKKTRVMPLQAEEVVSDEEEKSANDPLLGQDEVKEERSRNPSLKDVSGR